jgi:phage shock protein PspC (stress-responsive transcriptional regulator)
MKKTHSANIGGTVFHIEEDAYEKLQDYLQSIHAHFNFYPDVTEIVADIEARIAEQLLQHEPRPQVVRSADVERVIDAMGRIEQFGDPASGPAPTAAQALPSDVRKLYRDPEQKIIAGVASGLASYLGVSSLMVRIAFVLLLAFFGTSVIVYLLLWALVPMAVSATDKLQMRGRPLTLASIDQGVRDGIASIPPRTLNMAAQGITAAGSLIHLVVVTLAHWVKRVAGVFVVGTASLTLLLFTVMLVVALVNANAPPLPSGTADFLALFGTRQTALKIFAYLLMGIPLALVITTGLKLFWGVNRLNTRGLAGMLGVWVVSLLAAAAIWSGSYPALRRHMDDYPAMTDARRGVERIRAMAAIASPLSDEQSKALLSTLAAEYKRRRAEEEASFSYYYYQDPRAQIAREEERLKLRAASNQRAVEAAKAYLDAQQLAVMQDSMARYNASTLAALQIRRDRLEEREQ